MERRDRDKCSQFGDNIIANIVIGNCSLWNLTLVHCRLRNFDEHGHGHPAIKAIESLKRSLRMKLQSGSRSLLAMQRKSSSTESERAAEQDAVEPKVACAKIKQDCGPPDSPVKRAC